MLMHGTKVYDPTSGEILFNRYLALYQPRAAEGLWRANLNAEQFGPSSNQQTVFCKQDELGVWNVDSPAPLPRDESIHPDVDNFIAEYVTVARNVLSHVGAGYSLDIFFGSQENADHQYDDEATVYIQAITGPAPYTVSLPHPDDNFLNHVPGLRSLENAATNLMGSLGAQYDEDDGNRLIGELSFHLTAESFLASYDINGDVSFTLESKLVDGHWQHTSEIFLALPPSSNVVEEMKRLASEAQKIFDQNNAEFAFKEAFPAFNSGPIIVSSADHDNNGWTFRFGPGALRGKAADLPN